MKLTGLAVTLGLLFAPLALAASAGAVDIQHVVSPKGVEAWLVEEHTVPVIAVSFAFEGGSAQDPAGKAGVANMLSGLLDEGAGDARQPGLPDRARRLLDRPLLRRRRATPSPARCARSASTATRPSA